MKTIKVSIKGVTPILMNKYIIDTTKSRSISKTYDPKIEAEKSAYWSSGKKKELIIPSEIMYASMLNASSFHKIGKRSAKSILAGSIRVEPMEISLGTAQYDIDTRPVVIGRARVLKSRARINEWKATFDVVYNEDLIADPEIINVILKEAGERIGIMDFRPNKGGPYGCFVIDGFKY